jgi:mitochondrial inner membrane protease subunit 1
VPGFAHRLAGIPWRSIARQGLSRVFLVAKAYCVIQVINEHLCSVALVRGASMLPALNLAGDVVVMDRVSMRLGRVTPRDIVLMISPEDPRKWLVKRVVGMQGTPSPTLSTPTTATPPPEPSW